MVAVAADDRVLHAFHFLLVNVLGERFTLQRDDVLADITHKQAFHSQQATRIHQRRSGSQQGQQDFVQHQQWIARQKHSRLHGDDIRTRKERIKGCVRLKQPTNWHGRALGSTSSTAPPRRRAARSHSSCWLCLPARSRSLRHCCVPSAVHREQEEQERR